ncbi:MAG: 5'-methylthioadenosine phosphorylase [Alphaproteobacteria bacterium CG_4_9_14_3_um_filter_47_13]|nr:MAG: 5'-methylthioadenosine phosphorylase [Alphaproteobacteria bacterium CG_4_9_14_3_um_filter_47_13]
MLGVIGGSGLYKLDGLSVEKEHEIETPFGRSSDAIIEGLYQGQRVLFLPRHGRHHEFLPHEVNYRANIFALKKLGARRIFSVSAAGSLREEIKPGDLALAAQYYDHTKGWRVYSFFGGGVSGHVSTAYPACPALSKDIEEAAKRLGQPLHTGKTYACVEGPRLGTRAESFFLRDAAKCDLVGMTNVPEVFLAREAQLAYCTVCLVTDYDCWMDDPAQHVSVEKFFEVYGGAVEKAKTVLAELLKKPFTDTPDDIRASLKTSILTPDSAISPEQKEWLDVLRA